MARLRVGDIEIDGSNVTIGGRAPAPGPAGALSPAKTRTAPASLASDNYLTRIRPPASLLVIAGIFLGAAGVVTYFVSAPMSPLGYLLHGGIFVSAGAGLVALGVLKKVAQQRIHQATKAAAEQELQADMAAVWHALTASPAGNTVERLMQICSLVEARVVRALIALRTEATVTEELNVETGDWYYEAVSLPSTASSVQGPKNLDDRMKELERRHGR